MSQRQTDEAFEKLSQGIEESRRAAQRQAMELAQEYFGDSVEELKRQMQESRSRLQSLPDEVPGGQDELFRKLFGELMESYSKLESCFDEAQRSVSEIDVERLGSQGGGSGMAQPEATDAARRAARDRGIDLSEVEATGAEGQIIVSDVVEFAERNKSTTGEEVGRAADLVPEEAAMAQPGQLPDTLDGQVNGSVGEALGQTPMSQAQGLTGGVIGESGGQPRVTSAARRKAEELGVDLNQVQGTGADGLITLKDVLGA